MIPVADLGNDTVEYAGNMGQYAGTTAELTITGLPTGYEGYIGVDAISFSPKPVPEPATLVPAAVALCGVLPLVAWRPRQALLGRASLT